MNLEQNHHSSEFVVFLCSGLGMGNATRTYSICQQLCRLSPEIKICVMTWGNGLKFYRQALAKSSMNIELYELQGYQNPMLYIPAYIKNCASIRRELARVRPIALVLDSDYHYFGYSNFKNKIIFVGHAMAIVKNWYKYGKRQISITLHFIFREVLDLIYQIWVADLIIVPDFIESVQRVGRFVRVPLIVREEFLTIRCDKSKKKIGILTGGSVQRQELLDLVASDHRVELLSSVPSRAEELASYEFMLIQGGLSSLSECLALGSKIFALPLAGHAEQFVNTSRLHKLGRLTQLENLSDLDFEMIRNFDEGEPGQIFFNGSEHSARLISEILSARPSNG